MTRWSTEASSNAQDDASTEEEGESVRAGDWESGGLDSIHSSATDPQYEMGQVI